MAVIKEAKKVALSYFSKDKIPCPVCKKAFSREIMRSGNGRMIAGKLTDELHRIYEPSAKYGRVYPMIYEIGACPYCYTAMFWNDFKGKSFLPFLFFPESAHKDIQALRGEFFP